MLPERRVAGTGASRAPLPVDESRRQVRRVLPDRSKPAEDKIAMDDSSPTTDAYDIVESSKRRASSASLSVRASNAKGSSAPFQPTT